MNLVEAIEQLESCHFECEGGSLECNVAFIAIKRFAEKFGAINLSAKGEF